MKAGAAAGITLLLAIAFASWAIAAGPTPDPLPFEVPTRDGFILKGVRYARPGAQPVVVKPGVIANTYMFKVFGAELHENLDVWMVNARAHGKGGHRSAPSSEAATHAGHGFDAMVLEDVEPVLDHIRRETGFEKVAMIGHSMGGLIEKAYLRGAVGSNGIVTGLDAEVARTRSSHVLGLYTLGSPWHFQDVPTYIEYLVRALRAIPDSPEFTLPATGPEIAPTVPDSTGARARLKSLFWKPVDRIGMPLLFPPGIVDASKLSPKEVRRLREKAVSRIAGDLVGDFRRWVRNRKIESRAGVSYEQAIPIEVPWVAYGGSADSLVHIEDLIEESRRFGNTLVELPGMAHVNMVYGEGSRYVARDIRQRILALLENGAPNVGSSGRIALPNPGCPSGRLRDRFFELISSGDRTSKR